MSSGSAAPQPVDWGLAERLAHRVAGHDPLEDSYLASSLQAEFDVITARAEELVAEFTGLYADGGPARARVLDRQRWVEANIRSFRTTLEPFTARVGERMAQSPLAPAGRSVAGAEMGVLMGFLAQRVLGQYDLLGPEEADADTIYYVGPNMLVLEKRFGFRPGDFRLWIALHEVTHRAQFRAIPWMKDYFLSLVDASMSMIEPDPKRLVRALERAAECARKGRNPLDDGGIVALFASDEQRAVIDKVQALMSLLEGHGNVVMDRLGRRHVTGQERMSAALKARRQSGGIRGQFSKLIGMEMKLRQYEIGEEFITRLEETVGIEALDAAWRGPDCLPTMAELETPERWLERVGTLTA
ncbi:MAG TPA: zinc-dependent metalloprotease [Acidimicrobiia bacterium]|nr:zinc-dependent metalloprotease [Acidimicrobiia bacterium]